MAYASPVQGATEVSGVALSAKVWYQPVAPAGTISIDLVTPVAWSLRPRTGNLARVIPYSTTIGDFKVEIGEVNNPQANVASTEFETYDDQIVIRSGTARIADLVASRMVPFVEDVIKSAAGVAIPFFGPLLADLAMDVFRGSGPPAAPPRGTKSISVGVLPWWSLKLWNYFPGFLPLRFRIGYVLSGTTTANAPIRLRGPVRYRLDVHAETGTMLQHVKPTGVVSLGPLEFTIDWT